MKNKVGQAIAELHQAENDLAGELLQASDATPRTPTPSSATSPSNSSTPVAYRGNRVALNPLSRGSFTTSSAGHRA
jgi:hypothetical protein